MDWTLFWIFVALNIVNVILSTAKSIATIKCGKLMAAVINAISYGVYTVVVVYTVCELPLWTKVVVVAIANFIGVYVVKMLEDKARKDRLWKVEAEVKEYNTTPLHKDLNERGIMHNYIEGVGKSSIFNCYCRTKKESLSIKELLNTYNAVYFVSESDKTL